MPSSILFDWDVLSPSPERRQIDDAVFDALDLSQDKRVAVYEGMIELAENRRRRARNLSYHFTLTMT